MSEPWAIVCHKGMRLGGVISPTLTKKEIAKFISEFVADGYGITTVYSREEYLALINPMTFGEDNPQGELA